MEITELRTRSERQKAVPIVQQLWTDADDEAILEWTGEDDYHLFGAHVDGELVGIAGVLVGSFLHHVRHAWLYDLVVDESQRGQGYGTELVSFAEEWANEQECDVLALASPRSKTAVHDYYESRGFDRWGYVIEKDLS